MKRKQFDLRSQQIILSQDEKLKKLFRLKKSVIQLILIFSLYSAKSLKFFLFQNEIKVFLKNHEDIFSKLKCCESPSISFHCIQFVQESTSPQSSIASLLNYTLRAATPLP
jgi:hypothetical protein